MKIFHMRAYTNHIGRSNPDAKTIPVTLNLIVKTICSRN
jgi:hypothetical protein